MDIHEARTEGRTLKFIENFLEPKFFKIKVNEVLSDTKVQTEGIPKGSVVSPTFFILKINKILANLPNDNRLQISLYMDDLQITNRHQNLEVVERKLRDSINIVENFAQKNRFKFSTSKTSMLHFTKMLIPPPIELRLGNSENQKSETEKIPWLSLRLKI